MCRLVNTRPRRSNLLIKARSDIRWAFGRSPSAAALQRFDREQMQRLRKPKSKEEQADLLASKLEAMAVEERLIYETLGGEPCEQGSPSNSPAHAENAQKEAATARSWPARAAPARRGPGCV